MKQNLKQRIALIVAVLLVFLFGIFRIPEGISGKALLAAMQKQIHLGLDLQGGVHLILQVQVQEAVSDETDSAAARVRDTLKTGGFTYSQVIKPDPNKPELIEIDGTAAEKASDVRSLLDGKFSNEYDLNAGGTENSWTLTMKPVVEKDLEQKTVGQAIETIRDRVDSLGTFEPIIAPYSLGANQILVELPGVSDLDKVKGLIQSTARLEVHAVMGGDGQGFQDEQAALASVNGALPPDQYIVPCQGDMACHGNPNTVYILGRAPVVSGTDFRSADPSTNSNTGGQIVRFTLTDEAGERFWDYTNANVGKYMAIVMGGHAREVAVIKNGIRDTGEIEGSFTESEVTMLSKMLRTGALPASLVFLEDRTVGASLGADSIREGVTAAVVGVLVVMAFMLIYYKSSGINADLALFLNLVILLGFLGFSGATLTLPGIAGVILTIGMGVDSNVLIFERIREEIRAGKAASAAVDQGFANAWRTIVDTHVTTIVSAAMLFLFGTGPVRGFATTLTFGLLANLFTAVYVSRVIFEAHLNKLKPGEMVSI
ncbi:MAG: protein translocase subunit SecD [Terracidiphilus sp.]|jgi:preprotein translocase subunit SecD